MQISPNSVKKVKYMHWCKTFMQIRCQKGEGTKMHKCLVGPSPNTPLKMLWLWQTNYNHQTSNNKVTESFFFLLIFYPWFPSFVPTYTVKIRYYCKASFSSYNQSLITYKKMFCIKNALIQTLDASFSTSINIPIMLKYNNTIFLT